MISTSAEIPSRIRRLGWWFLALLLLVQLASCSEKPRSDRQDEPAGAESSSETGGKERSERQDGAAESRQTAVERPSPPSADASPALLPIEERQAGWIQLFDGRSLFGWQSNNPEAEGGPNWRVQEGVITADSGDQGLLLTAVRFADYELRFDYRLEPGGNSGVFLRTVFSPKDPAVDCYEFNLCDTHSQYPTASLVGRQRVENIEADGRWTTFHLRVEANEIVAQIDGRIVLDFVDTSDHQPRIGYIGLQKNQGKIEFRNVVLRPLGTIPLTNGTDLSGWREVPGAKAEFTVEQSALRVRGGPGFLETEKTWDNFVLQFDARTNREAANSGLFFRAMKGTEEHPSAGYELQICNSFAEGDRTRPNDYGRGFGTGAIMHRAPARYVVADDNQWFTVTLVAHGPRFASWVDGYPVMHWIDERPPHENPRQGRRLEAGHISLQGHDETTDVSFRHLRLAVLPAE